MGDSFIHLQQRRRAHGVRGVAHITRCAKAPKGVGSAARNARIYEQREILTRKIKGVLDLQLNRFHQLPIGGEFPPLSVSCKSLQQNRPQGIVAAARIAEAKDHQASTLPQPISSVAEVESLTR